MKKFILILILAATLLGSLPELLLAQTKEAAPDFSLADTNSTMVSLANYKGKQGVVLFFWTTWCPFCLVQLEVINDKYLELSRRGLVVLGINSGEPAARVQRFLSKHPLKYNVLLDEYAELALKYQIIGVPTYVLVDKQGNIVYQDNYFPSESELQAALK